MKNFNFRRFLLTLKWDAKTNIRYNVRHWLIMLTLFFFSILLPHACVITEGDKGSGTFVEEITEEEFQKLSKEEQKTYTQSEVVLEKDDVEVDAKTSENIIKDNEKVQERDNDNDEIVVNDDGVMMKGPNGKMVVNDEGVVMKGPNGKMVVNDEGVVMKGPKGEMIVNDNGVVKRSKIKGNKVKDNDEEGAVVAAKGDTVQVWTREMPYMQDKWEDRVTTQHWVSAILLMFIVWFYFTFSASLFLNNLTTKQRRIAFFSLPANHSEKLLARWIYAVPVWLLMIITALCVADVLRYAVQPLIGPHSPGLMITWLWETGNDMIKEALDGWEELAPSKQDVMIATIVMQITGTICSHSTYILGSSMFPRFPWLITTGIIWVIASIFSIVLLTLNIDGFIDFMVRMKDGDAVGQIYTIAVTQLLVSILFYVLAIIIYRRMQVINHKLINL